MAKVSLQIKHGPQAGIIPQHDFSGAQRGLENLGAILEQRRQEKREDKKEADESEQWKEFIVGKVRQDYPDQPELAGALENIDNVDVLKFAYSDIRQKKAQEVQAKTVKRDLHVLMGDVHGQEIMERHGWLQDPEAVAQADPRDLDQAIKEVREKAEWVLEKKAIEQAGVGLLADAEQFLASMRPEEFDPIMWQLVDEIGRQMEGQQSDATYPVATKQDLKEMRDRIRRARMPKETADEWEAEVRQAAYQEFIQNIHFDMFSDEQDKAVMEALANRAMSYSPQSIAGLGMASMGLGRSNAQAPGTVSGAASSQTPSEAAGSTQAPSQPSGSRLAPEDDTGVPTKSEPQAKTEVRTGEGGGDEAKALVAEELDAMGLEPGASFDDLAREIMSMGPEDDANDARVSRVKHAIGRSVKEFKAQNKGAGAAEVYDFIVSLGVTPTDALLDAIFQK